MNEDIKKLKKEYHVSSEDIGNYIGYSGGYIQYLLGKELTEEKRELIINAINVLRKEKIQNYVKK